MMLNIYLCGVIVAFLSILLVVFIDMVADENETFNSNDAIKSIIFISVLSWVGLAILAIMKTKTEKDIS